MHRRSALALLSAAAAAPALAGCAPLASAARAAVSDIRPVNPARDRRLVPAGPGLALDLAAYEPGLRPTYPFTLPDLPYAADALERAIDAATMREHHGRHHQAYVNGLNAALEDRPELHRMPLDALLRAPATLPEAIRLRVLDQGGGHLNHAMFWRMLSPEQTEPAGALADALVARFGSVEAFQEAFRRAATGLFGSGWVWLARGPEGTLEIVSTGYQEPPHAYGWRPLFGLDVWEHAYYLRYQSRRAEYVDAVWRVVNWPHVARLFAG
ncbi:MAG: superoxide dismutase [Rubricoccaceae bacterium]